MSEAQTELWERSKHLHPSTVATFVRALSTLLAATHPASGITRHKLEWAIDQLVELLEIANDAIPKVQAPLVSAPSSEGESPDVETASRPLRSG